MSLVTFVFYNGSYIFHFFIFVIVSQYEQMYVIVKYLNMNKCMLLLSISI